MANSSVPIYKFVTEVVTATSNGTLPFDEADMIQLRYNTSVTILIITITSLLPVLCISGNSLVILSIIHVQKLRTPANYLVVSLAVSDLLVGLIVMPLATLQEVLTAWPLGKDICFMWVSFDVTLCTASILNLMMISIDRYMIINYPYKYSENRTGKLMLVFIAIAWVVSLTISITPTFVGWRPDYGPTGKGCRVNQQIGYQMYATFVAFYLPLTVMLILYGKIYLISRRFTQAEAKTHPTLKNKNRDDDATTMSCHSSYASSPVTASKHGNKRRRETVSGVGPVHTLAVDSTMSLPIDHNAINDIITEDDDSSEPPTEKDWLRGNERYSSHLTVDKCHQTPHHQQGNGHHNHHHRHESWPLKKISQVTIASVKRFLQRHHKHKTHTRAIRTLGIIMGSFTACWLPFFVLAVVYPLCEGHCKIPMSVYGIFLWIGYANSCINPLIYARFNREYRVPFREFLCCRCHKVNESVRHTDYMDQYGDPEDT